MAGVAGGVAASRLKRQAKEVSMERWRKTKWQVRMLRMRARLEASALLWKVGTFLYRLGSRLQIRSSRMLMALLERDNET